MTQQANIGKEMMLEASQIFDKVLHKRETNKLTNLLIPPNSPISLSKEAASSENSEFEVLAERQVSQSNIKLKDFTLGDGLSDGLSDMPSVRDEAVDNVSSRRMGSSGNCPLNYKSESDGEMEVRDEKSERPMPILSNEL